MKRFNLWNNYQKIFCRKGEMDMSKNYNQISKEILEHIGGKENIVSAAHCATRLRIVVSDKEKIDTKSVEALDKVKG